MSNGSSASTTIKGIPRPSAPGALSNNLLQNVSVYKALRSVIDLTNATTGIAGGSVTFGTVATTATDGGPATFTKGGLDAVLIRVAAAGNAATLGIANEWIAGGGETAIAHGLGRVPIGYWVVKNSVGAMISDGDSSWTTTNIYFHTTHSNSDCILMIF
jgi:hypothetical protein